MDTGMIAEKEVVNLDFRHKSFQHGDLTVIITWTLFDRRPCLVIIPTYQRVDSNVITPVIVPDTMAWAWSEDKALRDVKHCVESSLHMAMTIFGPGATVAQANRIATLIHDHIDDLIICPPMPALFDTRVVAFTRRTDASGEVIEGEVKSDV